LDAVPVTHRKFDSSVSEHSKSLTVDLHDGLCYWMAECFIRQTIV